MTPFDRKTSETLVSRARLSLPITRMQVRRLLPALIFREHNEYSIWGRRVFVFAEGDTPAGLVLITVIVVPLGVDVATILSPSLVKNAEASKVGTL